MVEVKKSKFQYKRIVVILVIALIAFKSYQHFKPRDLISIIGEESILNPEKVNIHRFGGLSSAAYDFDIEDKEDIKRLIQLMKSIKIRRYGMGKSGVRYDGHIDNITFNNNKTIVRIEIIGEQYVYLYLFPQDIGHNEYKIIGDIDTSFIDKIIDKKSLKSNNNEVNDVFSLIDIYQLDDNTYWDYILPDKTHMYKQLWSKDVREKNTKLSMQYVSDPIDDEGKYRDRIKEQEVEITPNQISIDNTVVLKAPLKKGNTWETSIQLSIDGVSKTYEATVNIEEVTEKTVTTRLVVTNLGEFKEKEYIKIQTYQKNFGIIYESYNDKDGQKHETKLEKVYKNVIHEFIDPREFMKFNDLDVIEGNFFK